MQRGTIQKIVRLASNSDRFSPPDGYGIIRSDEGRDIYFLLDRVAGWLEGDIASGMKVDFELEDGPFARAERVIIVGSASCSPEVKDV